MEIPWPIFYMAISVSIDIFSLKAPLKYIRGSIKDHVLKINNIVYKQITQKIALTVMVPTTYQSR